MSVLRKNHEPPPAIAAWGWRFHHLGIPVKGTIRDAEYLKEYKFWHGGFYTSPFGVEWMRFEASCRVPELVRTTPHVAFEVDDLDAALVGLEVIIPPGSPSRGVRAAMVVHDGAPVELIEFRSDLQPTEGAAAGS